MGHIGIVACSAEGAALCYRTICVEGEAMLGRHPEVSLHGFALADYSERLERGDLAGVGELMLGSVEKLARIGATIAICPDNTIHTALPGIVARSPIPWLHIADVVADEAARRGYRRVGILGTRWLVDSDVYPGKLAERGIEAVRPLPADRDRVHAIIMEELVRGRFLPASTAELHAVIARLVGCDAVVLGCTELPLVIVDAAVPTLDSTRLLARAALRV